MSNAPESSDQSEPEIGISDDQLPEDLVPSEDNPLAVGLEGDQQVDDLMESGKPVERSNPDGPGGPDDDAATDDADDRSGS